MRHVLTQLCSRRFDRLAACFASLCTRVLLLLVLCSVCLQARNYLKDMKRGQLCFFYHSSCAVPGVAGIMEVATEVSGCSL